MKNTNSLNAMLWIPTLAAGMVITALADQGIDPQDFTTEIPWLSKAGENACN